MNMSGRLKTLINIKDADYKLNVFVGLLGDITIGSNIYEEIFTPGGYLQVSRTYLTNYIDNNIPLNRLINMWYQQNGASPQKARSVADYLAETFPVKLFQTVKTYVDQRVHHTFLRWIIIYGKLWTISFI